MNAKAQLLKGPDNQPIVSVSTYGDSDDIDIDVAVVIPVCPYCAKTHTHGYNISDAKSTHLRVPHCEGFEDHDDYKLVLDPTDLQWATNIARKILDSIQEQRKETEQ